MRTEVRTIFYAGKYTQFSKHFLLVLRLNFGAHLGAHIFYAGKCTHFSKHFLLVSRLNLGVKFQKIPQDLIFSQGIWSEFWPILRKKSGFFSPKFTFRQGIWSEILTNSDKKKHSNFDILARYMVGMLTNFEGKKAGFAVKFWCALHFMLEKAHFWKSTPRNNVCVFFFTNWDGLIYLLFMKHDLGFEFWT